MARHQGLSFYRRRERISKKVVKEIFDYIFVVVIAVGLAVLVTYCFGMSTYVVGVSMEPTLYNGQKVYIDRISYAFDDPDAGDVIVFLPNGNQKAHYYVKRVVAVPGDTVQIKDGMLYVNGVPSEVFTDEIVEAGIAGHELKLEKDEFFCIGDNSANSEDSRFADIGPVQSQDVVGKVWFAAKTAEGKTGFVK